MDMRAIDNQVKARKWQKIITERRSSSISNCKPPFTAAKIAETVSPNPVNIDIYAIIKTDNFSVKV